MSKKDELLKVLANLSEEEINDLLDSRKQTKEKDNVKPNTHTIRRRGSGYNKKLAKQNKEKKNKKKRSRESKGRACRQLPMEIGHERPNLFENMIKKISLTEAEKKELNEAKKADDVARKTKKSFVKPARQTNLIDVECCVCGSEYEVSASIVHDVDRWKCNDCSCQPGY